MAVFWVVASYKPKKKEKDDKSEQEKERIIYEPKAIIADSKESALKKGIIMVPAEYHEKMDEVEVEVAPFR